MHETEEDSEEGSMTMFQVGDRSAHQPIQVPIEINGQTLNMELDTGAAVSIISSHTKDQLFSEEPLMKTSTVLTTYTGEQMTARSQILVKVRYGSQMCEQLPLYVVEGVGPSLMGRDWLRAIRLDWESIARNYLQPWPFQQD